MVPGVLSDADEYVLELASMALEADAATTTDVPPARAAMAYLSLKHADRLAAFLRTPPPPPPAAPAIQPASQQPAAGVTAGAAAVQRRPRPRPNQMQAPSIALLATLVHATGLRDAPELARLTQEWVATWAQSSGVVAGFTENVRRFVARVLSVYASWLVQQLTEPTPPALPPKSPVSALSAPPTTTEAAAAPIAPPSLLAPIVVREEHAANVLALLDAIAVFRGQPEGMAPRQALMDQIALAVQALAPLPIASETAPSILTRCAALSSKAEDAMVTLCERHPAALDATVAAATGSSAPSAVIRGRAWSAVVRYCTAAMSRAEAPLESPLVAKLLVLSLVQLCAPQQSARAEATSALVFMRTHCGLKMPPPPPSPPQHEALQRASALRLSASFFIHISVVFVLTWCVGLAEEHQSDLDSAA